MNSNVQPPILVSFERQAVYEIGATLLTVLTMSEPKDTDNDRSRILMSLCKWALSTRAGRDPDWATADTQIKPMYAAWSESAVDRDVKQLNRRMRDRMLAAHMVMPFLKQAQTGKIPVLAPAVRRLTINKMAERVLPLSTERDVGNLKTRVWRPSRTVLHLAAAVEVVRQFLERQAKIPLDYNILLWDEFILRWILAEAKSYEAMFTKSHENKQLRVDPKLLVRIRVSKKRVQKKAK